MKEINKKNLKKTHLFIGLEDVLIPGNAEKEINLSEVKKIIRNLIQLNEKVPEFDFFILTGLREKEALKRIRNFPFLNEVKDKIMSVTEGYIDSKEPQDKEFYLKRLNENHEFKDEYFKQTVIQGFIGKGVGREKIELIGHDVWTDGFYTTKFSNVDFALIKSSLTHLDNPLNQEIPGVVYIERTWKDFKKILLGELKKPSLEELDKYVLNYFRKHLIADELNKLKIGA
ncbi:MAG TPA: hypothetical protein VJK05_05715 [archaeon]|nr:hypothetical protein [archaeon]